jgi:hypothetical protein
MVLVRSRVTKNGQEPEIEHRGDIRRQTIGTALDPDRLDRLARYENHLDRKLERMLAMLLKMQQIRAERAPPAV